MRNRQTTRDADHLFVCNANDRVAHAAIFDSDIGKRGYVLRQPFVMASFCPPVEAATRHAVESAFSTNQACRCNGLKERGLCWLEQIAEFAFVNRREGLHNFAYPPSLLQRAHRLPALCALYSCPNARHRPKATNAPTTGRSLTLRDQLLTIPESAATRSASGAGFVARQTRFIRTPLLLEQSGRQARKGT